MITTPNSPLSKARFNQGFTLVELLIAMGLLSIMLVVLTNVFVSALDLQLRSAANSSLQQDSQFILSRLQYDVDRASSLTTPSSIGSETQQLVLEVDGESVSYTVIGGELIASSSANSDQVNGYLTSLEDFRVTRLGNVGGDPSVKVEFSLTSDSEGSSGNNIATHSTTLGIR